MQPGRAPERALARSGLRRSTLGVEHDFTIRRQRFARDGEAYAAFERFELERQAARQIFHDLLTDAAMPGKRLDWHPLLLQPACPHSPKRLSSGARQAISGFHYEIVGVARAGSRTTLREHCPFQMATILVADDNRANREALAALLELAGHEVLRAADGREALATRAGSAPRAGDFGRADADDGRLRARAPPARRSGAPPSAAVMFYTAYFGGQDAQALAQAHGVSRVLVKPSDNDEILRQVRRGACLAPRGPGAGAARTSTRSTCA